MRYFLLILVVATLSCNWAKQKTKETVNKTGEAVGTAGSEFVDGVAKGVEKTFESELKISDELTRKGLKAGKVLISSTDSSTDNVLTPYFIFDGDIDQSVTVKVFTSSDTEYGRVSHQIRGNKGEAKYLELVFDKRTNIDSRSKIVIE